MPSRREQYFDTYARAQASIERQEQIRKDIADEQQQVRYLDSLLAQERQTLAAIEQNFRVAPPQSLDQAVSLLKERYETENLRREVGARGAAAREASTTLTPADITSLTETKERKADAILRNAETLIRNPATTKEKADAAFKMVVDQLGAGAPGMGSVLDALKGKTAPAERKGAAGARKLTPEEEARERALDEAFRTAFFAGPSGIVGGYEGKAVADARKTTLAPENTSFNTAEDAYNAAIAAMGDGSLDRGEFSTEDDFNYAKGVYAEAQAKKAYRNDERIHFEPSVLEARLRLKTLREQRDSARGASYQDPAREAAKRELMARGINIYEEDSPDAWRNQYAQYQGTPYYDVYVNAHEAVSRWLGEGGSKTLSPVTKAQKAAVQYASMLDTAKKPYSPATIMDELTRAGFSDSDAAEATSFLMAYKEIGGPKQGKTTYDALKAAEKKAQAELERKKLMAEEAEAYFEEGVKQLENAERRILEGAPADYATDYRRLVEAGVPPAKAREMVNTRALAAKAGVKGQEPGQPYEGVPKPKEAEVGVVPPGGKPRRRINLDELDEAEAPAQSVAPTPPSAPARTPFANTFTDPTDPNSPEYTATPYGYTYKDKAGKTVEVPLTSTAGLALSLAQRGEIDRLRKFQERLAEEKKKSGTGTGTKTGTGTGTGATKKETPEERMKRLEAEREARKGTEAAGGK